MRKGFNPNKNKKTSELDYFHQVIIPVYIPSNIGYFKESLDILKLTIQSLLNTSHEKTFVTIVNNGSNQEVYIYLESLLISNKIHEVIHTTNIGKINAILKGIAGHNFPLITISDADVLFLNNWQKETYAVFEAFPKTGFVSPCPIPKLVKYYTYNIIVDTLFSKQVKFTKVKNSDALSSFAKSIGNPNFYNQHHLDQYLTINNNKFKAVIGGGHFVGTYRSDVFKDINQRYSEFSLGGTSEIDFLDKPIVENGFWRLSTNDNYVYHMGNTLEGWFDKIVIEKKIASDFKKNEMPNLEPVKNIKIINWIKNRIFHLFISREIIWKKYLKFKGLNKNAANNY
ncbi:glycosyltransferase [Urechidicola croceus]|uniref:Glycosyltransferase 2-like domain-containing protein n=1 Tax=Urechidicola croceus TaxID=1850246 RepID=A0A1D8P4J3_9FLAO|nr:glycosyltransferase [Urechidicola croceus]AOW19510.1 hypothetical protein LPB138_01910 [Urechidicola croceus]